MKKIKLPVSATFSLSFRPSDLLKQLPKVKAGGGPRLVKIGSINADPKNEDLLQARDNAAQVIWLSISLERVMESVITKCLFGVGIGVNKPRDFFINYIISSNCFNFSEKRKIILALVNNMKLLKGKDKSFFENVLKKVIDYRNAFAHGRIVVDSERGCLLEYFSGTAREAVLDDSYWNDLEEKFYGAIRY